MFGGSPTLLAGLLLGACERELLPTPRDIFKIERRWCPGVTAGALIVSLRGRVWRI